MAVTSGVAIGTGLAAAAGATAAAIRAAKQRTKPNQTPYGASEDVYAAKDPNYNAGAQHAASYQNYQNNLASLGPRPPRTGGVPSPQEAEWDARKKQLDAAWAKQQQYLAGAAKDAQSQVLQTSGYDQAVNPLLDMQKQGAAVYGQAAEGIAGASQAAEQQRQLGLNAYSQAAQDQATSQVNGQQVTTQGMDFLNGYQPGAVSNAMARTALDQATQANLGAARSSGALGLRNALNANAQAGVGIAGQMAAQRAMEEQQYLGARVGQANADRDATLGQANLEQQLRLQAEEAQRQRVLQQQGLGLQAAQAALGTGLQSSATLGQQAIAREQTAAAGLDSIRNAQLEADMNYDARRQQEGQRRSDRLWGLAGGLVGVAGSALGKLGSK